MRSFFSLFQSPDVYYNCLSTQMGFEDIIDFLKFHHHLENLFEGD